MGIKAVEEGGAVVVAHRTTLRTAELGATGLKITRVGFGAWAIGGGGYEGGWGPQDDEDSIAAIHRALALGVNWIDTAAQYGLGHSERVIGRALAGVEPRPYVFTKGGLPEGPGRTKTRSLRRDSLLREVEGSRERLGVETIDLYQIHWPVPDEEIEEGWSTLAELKERGVVRHIGVSNFNARQLRRAQAIAPVETLQPPYSLIDRRIEVELLPIAEREGIGMIVYSPMASGLLSGAMTRERIAALPADDWRRHSEEFREPQLTQNLELVERLQRGAAPPHTTPGGGAAARTPPRHDTTPGAVAVAWTLRNPAVNGAIAGFRRPEQVDPIVAAANLTLDKHDIATILRSKWDRGGGARERASRLLRLAPVVLGDCARRQALGR